MLVYFEIRFILNYLKKENQSVTSTAKCPAGEWDPRLGVARASYRYNLTLARVGHSLHHAENLAALGEDTAVARSRMMT